MKNSADEHEPLSMMAAVKYGRLSSDTRCQHTLYVSGEGKGVT
jgi:hypothetical protein